MKKMNLLFAIDDGYVQQFMVTLYSIHQNSSNQQFSVYELQKTELAQNEAIEIFCHKLGLDYHPVVIGEKSFEDAPTTNRYPETIYYRLLAHEYLPQDLDKILGLEMGSDDYIVKPYSTKELVLRVNNMIKRVYHQGQSNIIRYLDYKIDVDKRLVYHFEEEVKLT